MTNIIKSTGSDAKSTQKKQDTQYDRKVISFARTLSLQISEWEKMNKCHYEIATLPGHDDKPVLVAYFHLPGHVLGKDESGVVTVDDVPLSKIVLDTIKKPSATKESGT
jgi:hypothetical protein